MRETQRAAYVMAGIPEGNPTLYRQVRFLVGDPTVWLSIPNADGSHTTHFILRDIELQRARRHARADQVHCPADFTPAGGLSGDRETATAQAAAECLVRAGVHAVVADRTLPLIYADLMRERGIVVQCDREMGVAERRQKDPQEIAWLREAQQATEQAIEMACRMIARASTDRDGTLIVDGQPLTSERVRHAVDVFLLQRNYDNPPAIIAGGPQGGDCHDHGSGVLRTEQPIIVDVFPRSRSTRYNGDCTRTVVHGRISSQLERMHAAVVAAKQAAIQACRAGVTGEAVNDATRRVISAHGFSLGLPSADASPDYCGITHGTGHGVGLDVHEPPLLDRGGPELLVGDVLTIEPGLYSMAIGGVRVEDMVVVTSDGCENLNQLQEGLDWM